jgi:hypothetical protein
MDPRQQSEKAMSQDERRITLLTQSNELSERNWNRSNDARNRIVLLDSIAMLRSTIISPLVRSDSDVERIVLDRCVSESEYLSLLTELPSEFTGDVLMIRDRGTSFLSATGHGGGRILYALSAEDVEFYLETMQLMQFTEEMHRGVLKFRPRIVEGIDDRASSRSTHDHFSSAADDDNTLRKSS